MALLIHEGFLFSRSAVLSYQKAMKDSLRHAPRSHASLILLLLLASLHVSVYQTRGVEPLY